MTEPPKASAEPPIFILEGQDVGIFDSVEQATGQLESIDVKAGAYEGYDAHGRRLAISADSDQITIELAEDRPSDVHSLEGRLRVHLLRLGEKAASQLDCDLACLVALSQLHSVFDRRAVRTAAAEVEDRFRAAFADRKGRLRVTATTASNIRTRTKSLELNAGVEWDVSRTYDHVHVEVARRRWFSWHWKRMRSMKEARSELETQLAEWLDRAGGMRPAP